MSIVSKFTTYYKLWMAIKFIPYVFKCLRSPVFSNIPEINYVLPKEKRGNSLKVIFLNVLHGMLLECYKDITGENLKRGSEHVLYLFMDIIKELDDCIDGDQNEYSKKGILYNPTIKEKRDNLKKFLELNGGKDNVFSFIKDMFEQNYSTYIQQHDIATEAQSFEEIKKLIEIDIKWLSYTMSVISIYNSGKVKKEIINDFDMIGFVGKISDDLVDLKHDIRNNRLNIIHSILKLNAKEYKKVLKLHDENKKIGIKFWKEECPVTFSTFIEMIDSYYRKIDSDLAKYLVEMVVYRGLNS